MAAQPMNSVDLTALLLSIAMMVVPQAASAGSSKNEGVGKANSTTAAEVLVAEACKNMTDDLVENLVHFHEEICVSVLLSDNRTLAAKDHGDLAVIALDLLANSTNGLAAKVDDMLRGLSAHNSTRYTLKYCSVIYAAMVRTVPICHEIFLDVKPLGKRVPWERAMDALTCLDRLGGPARECELMIANEWSNDYDKDDEFAEVVRHISLAWGLIEMATNYRDTFADW